MEEREAEVAPLLPISRSCRLRAVPSSEQRKRQWRGCSHGQLLRHKPALPTLEGTTLGHEGAWVDLRLSLHRQHGSAPVRGRMGSLLDPSVRQGISPPLSSPDLLEHAPRPVTELCLLRVPNRLPLSGGRF